MEGSPKNLLDGLREELNRCRELLRIYEGIPAGQFGAAMIRKDIEEGEAAISSGDVVRMISSYKSLKDCE